MRNICSVCNQAIELTKRGRWIHVQTPIYGSHPATPTMKRSADRVCSHYGCGPTVCGLTIGQYAW